MTSRLQFAYVMMSQLLNNSLSMICQITGTGSGGSGTGPVSDDEPPMPEM